MSDPLAGAASGSWWSGLGFRARVTVTAATTVAGLMGSAVTINASWRALGWGWFATEHYVEQRIRKLDLKIIDLQIDDANRAVRRAWRSKAQWEDSAKKATDDDSRARFETNVWEESRTLENLEKQLDALRQERAGL